MLEKERHRFLETQSHILLDLTDSTVHKHLPSDSFLKPQPF